MKRKRLWARLTPSLELFFELALDGKPTPGRLRLIAEVLLELREIMLRDDLEDTFTMEAANIIDMWIKGIQSKNSFDLLKELRDLREIAEIVSLDRKERKK